MSTGTSASPLRPLGERLLEEAMRIVRASGHGAVSLREVQRRAGVSPAAAYRHFRDRDALLLAVAREAAGILADRVAATLSAMPDDPPDERLAACCDTYLDFAFDEPGLYRMVFLSADRVEQLAVPGARGAGIDGAQGYGLFAGLVSEVAKGAGSAWAPVAVWAACHGFAGLRLDGPLRALDQQELAAARSRLVSGIVRDVRAG